MWKGFLLGVATGAVVAVGSSTMLNSVNRASNAGKERKAASEVHMVATKLSEFKKSHGNYPAVCDSSSFKAHLDIKAWDVSGEVGERLFYCSNGASYIFLYRPLGIEAPVDGIHGAYAITDGQWVAWPPDLPNDARASTK